MKSTTTVIQLKSAIVKEMMEEETTAEYILKVVSILTAIISGQEDEAYRMVLESNVTELFSALTGLLLSALTGIAEANDTTIESYLQELGLTAYKAIN